MGYADTLPYQQLTLYNSTYNSVELTTVAADYDLLQIQIPAFSKSLTHCYVDVIVNNGLENSGATNYLVGGSFGLVDSGAAFRLSGTVTNGIMYTTANEKWNGQYFLPGFFNIAPYVHSGELLTVRLHDFRCFADHLVLKGVYAQVRMYFIT